MLLAAVQPRLPLRPARVRSCRRPFTRRPDEEAAYRFPHDVHDRLVLALQPYRNREAAYTLALFVARFWSAPGRVAGSFPLDRRALADLERLGLTEARVRGAIRVLEEVGFLDRALTSGSNYKPTADGLRRKPILFTFGAEYFPLFNAANKRAAAARERRSRSAQYQTLVGAHQASTTSVEARPITPPSPWNVLNSPKDKSAAESSVLMGEVRIGIPASASVPDANLEAALRRWEKGFRRSRGGSGDDSAN